ncbi:MAG: VWA domain-containing protein, partial [Thermodesulfobacteriota bacterium]|nr:VWA domain-containing protein [Thermodesulfobacteriota bacterium]
DEVTQLERMKFNNLIKTFQQRVEDQKEHHDGEDPRRGAEGSSPFGHFDLNSERIRVAGQSGNRSAIQVAKERRFRNYRNDVILDVRHFQIALKRLRKLSRIGPEDELDLDATIDYTCRNAGDMEFMWKRSRKNTVKLLLLMDVGGSMRPYTKLCSDSSAQLIRPLTLKTFNISIFTTVSMTVSIEILREKNPHVQWICFALWILIIK